MYNLPLKSVQVLKMVGGLSGEVMRQLPPGGGGGLFFLEVDNFCSPHSLTLIFYPLSVILILFLLEVTFKTEFIAHGESD